MKKLITITFLLLAFAALGSAQYYGACPIECSSSGYDNCAECHNNAGQTIYRMNQYGVYVTCENCNALPSSCLTDPGACGGAEAIRKRAAYLALKQRHPLTFRAKVMIMVSELLNPARTVQYNGKLLPAGHPVVDPKNACQTRQVKAIMASAMVFTK